MTDVVGLRFVAEGEREAVAAISRYQAAASQLRSSVLQAASQIQRTSADWQRASQAQQQGVISANALKTAQIELARQLATLNGYVRSNGALNTQRALAELRAADATRRAAQAAEEHVRAQQQAAQAYARLQASINPAVAAQQRMAQAHQTVRAALAAEIITREEAARTLREYRAQASQVSVAQTRMGASSMFASRAQNATGMALQQTGYQVGDFLVQIQSGTSAFVAFGQQATQLVGILPMFGSVMGVSGTALIGLSMGLGIAIPVLTALGATIVRVMGESRTFSATLDDASRALDRYRDAAREARLGSADLAERFGAAAESLRPLLQDLAELERITAINNVVESFDALEVVSRGFLDNIRGALEGNAQLARRFAEELGVTADEYRVLTGSVHELREAENLEQRVAITRSLVDYTRLISGGIEEMTPRMRVFYQALVQAGIAAGEVAGAVDETSRNTRNLVGQIQSATSAASAFADAMARAASESAGIGVSTAGIQAEIAALQAGASQAEARAQAAAVTLREQLYADFPTSGVSPTSATTLVQQIEAEVDARRQQVLTREQAAEALQRLRQVESAGGGGGANTQSDFISRRLRELEIEREMLGLTQEQRREREIFYQLQQEYAGTAIGANETLLQQTAAQIAAQEHLNEIMQAQQRMQEQFASTAANLFIAAANGADAFRRALSQVLQQLASALANRAFRDLIMGGRGGDRGYDIVDLLIGGGNRFPNLSGGESVGMATRTPASLSQGTSMAVAPVRLQLETRVAQDGALQTYVAGVSGAILESEGPSMVKNEVAGGGLDRPMGARFGTRVSRLRR